MKPLSYAGYRFPPEIIQHAVWLYLRFTPSFRDVEELLAERGIETIRRWVGVFGPSSPRYAEGKEAKAREKSGPVSPLSADRRPGRLLTRARRRRRETSMR